MNEINPERLLDSRTSEPDRTPRAPSGLYLRYILTVNGSCTGCCSCEEFLPGFISKFEGKQQIGEWWLEKPDIVRAIDRAIKHCQFSAVQFRLMK